MFLLYRKQRIVNIYTSLSQERTASWSHDSRAYRFVNSSSSYTVAFSRAFLGVLMDSIRCGWSYFSIRAEPSPHSEVYDANDAPSFQFRYQSHVQSTESFAWCFFIYRESSSTFRVASLKSFGYIWKYRSFFRRKSSSFCVSCFSWNHCCRFFMLRGSVHVGF